jgi:glycosyltransferase involved in cell wall biosynthesis
MKKQLIDTYNARGNLLVLTNYPARGGGIHTAKIGGVSGFAKNTLLPLAVKYARDGRKIIVLADIIDKPALYEEDGMLIVRAWKRGTLPLYVQMLVWFIRFWKVTDVFVEFEFASYGDFAVTALFPAFLFLLRMAGRHITIALHQVVTDLWSIIGHIGLRFDSRQFELYNSILPVYYYILTHVSHHTIVLEEEFKKRLAHMAPTDRVTVIPHGIQEIPKMPGKKKSRKMLGLAPDEYIVTIFGFITWYKGTDLLVQLLSDPAKVSGKPLRLIVAGGASTSQKDKEHYRKYYKKVLGLARGKKHITVTGFVPEEKIPLYLASSDTVVFPYRSAMSSSGPLSLALACKKPFLISRALSALFHTADYKTALIESKLNPSTLLLPESARAIIQRLELINRPSKRKQIRRFVRAISEKRSFTNLAPSYYTVLVPKEVPSTVYRLLTSFR